MNSIVIWSLLSGRPARRVNSTISSPSSEKVPRFTVGSLLRVVISGVYRSAKAGAALWVAGRRSQRGSCRFTKSAVSRSRREHPVWERDRVRLDKRVWGPKRATLVTRAAWAIALRQKLGLPLLWLSLRRVAPRSTSFARKTLRTRARLPRLLLLLGRHGSRPFRGGRIRLDALKPNANRFRHYRAGRVASNCGT